MNSNSVCCALLCKTCKSSRYDFCTLVYVIKIVLEGFRGIIYGLHYLEMNVFLDNIVYNSPYNSLTIHMCLLNAHV